MNIMALKSVFALVISFLFTVYLVPLFRAIAIRFNILDIPDGKIKLHKNSTPHLGGVAVYCGFLCGLVFSFPFINNLFLFLVGCTLLLFLGLIDDLVPLRPYQKFFGQFVVAFCFLKSGLYLKEHFFYNYWNIIISGVWIVTVVNAFNLVDVMDGLATMIAIGSATAFLAISIALGHMDVAILLCAFLGALSAFFWYNRPPAQIYLGDAGSLFIGGFLATTPFLFNWGSYNMYGYLTPIVILGIPLLEVVSLLLVRLYKGIPFYQGSPDHFSHYLQSNGWNKQAILFYVIGASSILGFTSFLYATGFILLPLLIIFGVFFLGGWFAILAYK